MTSETRPRPATRRSVLAGAAAGTAIGLVPALGEQRLGPPPHEKGPRVFLDYDQVELDAAYDQEVYQPNIAQVSRRLAGTSEFTRSRIGPPTRVSYGPSDIEKLDIYRTRQADAPIFVFIHGGAWRANLAKNYAFPAEMFVRAGAHYVVPDFVWVQDAGGSLAVMADQVRRAIAWTHGHAASFGGDPRRLYLGGNSSGAHLAGVALTTDWEKEFGLPPDLIKAAILVSGIYDLKPVRLSKRSSYVAIDDAAEEALSPQRHIGRIRCPVLLAYASHDTPEFQRQTRDFAAALQAAGKPVRLIVGENYSHLELPETLANPYGLLGSAALAQMNLAQAC